jgi:hypothetical protein
MALVTTPSDPVEIRGRSHFPLARGARCGRFPQQGSHRSQPGGAGAPSPAPIVCSSQASWSEISLLASGRSVQGVRFIMMGGAERSSNSPVPKPRTRRVHPPAPPIATGRRTSNPSDFGHSRP